MVAQELIIDLFAGGGGASQGIEDALGMHVDIAINHDPEAIEMHKANHPDTLHYTEDVFKVNPLECTSGQPVGLLWASPDCTHFSKAKGGKPVKKEIRSLAWVVVHWAQIVRPRIIILENVTEFSMWGPLTADNKPDPARKGETFKLWAGQLRNLGYHVEFKEIVACDYGAPTIRKRLFMIARCDSRSIVWPQPTHGPGRPKPYRTAAECIDFTIPCPSIFERKRPLAEATRWRIARGIQKFVIEAAEPFVIGIDHQTSPSGVWNIAQPLRTITKENRFAMVAPTLIQSGYGERKGQAPRAPGLQKPLGTVVAGACKHAMVAAFLSKYYTGVDGSGLEKPAPTVTAIDHNALVATHLTKFYGTNIGSDCREPMPTITASGQHVGEVRAFLLKYYSTNVGHSLRGPMHTLTSKHRLGLVTVAGQKYRIADIGLRMLQPRELARAQGFGDDYELVGTKTSQIAKIGNSVCPPIAKVLVDANVKIMEHASIKVG